MIYIDIQFMKGHRGTPIKYVRPVSGIELRSVLSQPHVTHSRSVWSCPLYRVSAKLPAARRPAQSVFHLQFLLVKVLDWTELVLNNCICRIFSVKCMEQTFRTSGHFHSGHKGRPINGLFRPQDWLLNCCPGRLQTGRWSVVVMGVWCVPSCWHALIICVHSVLMLVALGQTSSLLLPS